MSGENVIMMEDLGFTRESTFLIHQSVDNQRRPAASQTMLDSLLQKLLEFKKVHDLSCHATTLLCVFRHFTTFFISFISSPCGFILNSDFNIFLYFVHVVKVYLHCLFQIIYLFKKFYTNFKSELVTQLIYTAFIHFLLQLTCLILLFAFYNFLN